MSIRDGEAQDNQKRRIYDNPRRVPEEGEEAADEGEDYEEDRHASENRGAGPEISGNDMLPFATKERDKFR